MININNSLGKNIKLNYSATKEGKNAEIIINEILPLVKNKDFKKN